MGLKNWWQKRLETLAKEELNAYWEAYLMGYKQSPAIQRRILARQSFPRVGQDLLMQKEFFMDGYSIYEHEFRKNYLLERQSDKLACRYSLELEEKARLDAHRKWCEMLCQFQKNQKSKTR